MDWLTRMAALTGSKLKRMFDPNDDDDDLVLDLMLAFFGLMIFVAVGLVLYGILAE